MRILLLASALLASVAALIILGRGPATDTRRPARGEAAPVAHRVTLPAPRDEANSYRHPASPARAAQASADDLSSLRRAVREAHDAAAMDATIEALRRRDAASARQAEREVVLDSRCDPDLRIACLRRLADDPAAGRCSWLRYLSEHGDRPELVREARKVLASKGGVR